MSVNTIVFVTAGKSEMRDLMVKLTKDLNKWQRNLLKGAAKKDGKDTLHFFFQNRKDWSNGVMIDTYDFLSFNLRFKINGESRSLFITADCSSDYENVFKGEKIIFNTGKWGKHKEIMGVVRDSIRGFGDVYYCMDSCSEDFKLISTLH